MPGAERLRDSLPLKQLVERHASSPSSPTVAAICAAPVVALQAWGVLDGSKAATAHPAFADKLILPDPSVVASRVVEDGNVVTSRGPGTTTEFALALVTRLLGPEAASTVADALVLPRHDGTDVWRVEVSPPGPLKSDGQDSSVLVLVADGTEEIEAIIPADVLVRAGAKVTVASVEESLEITARCRTCIVADTLLADLPQDTLFDVVVVPGGLAGAEKFKSSAAVSSLLTHHAKAGKIVSALCASTLVLQEFGLLEGRKATTHPAVAEQLKDKSALEARVVVDGPVVTTRGPGTAFEFALTLVRILYGEDKTAAVAKPMVMKEELVPVGA